MDIGIVPISGIDAESFAFAFPISHVEVGITNLNLKLALILSSVATLNGWLRFAATCLDHFDQST
jgi:hypothetical protein